MDFMFQQRVGEWCKDVYFRRQSAALLEMSWWLRLQGDTPCLEWSTCDLVYILGFEGMMKLSWLNQAGLDFLQKVSSKTAAPLQWCFWGFCLNCNLGRSWDVKSWIFKWCWPSKYCSYCLMLGWSHRAANEHPFSHSFMIFIGNKSYGCGDQLILFILQRWWYGFTANQNFS